MLRIENNHLMFEDKELCSIEGKKAFMFDLDGTLADTMTAHDKAYELAFSLNGIFFDIEEHEKYAPLGGKVLMEETVVKKGHPDKVKDIIRDKQELLPVCLRKFMTPNEGLVKLVRDLYKHHNVKLAVVSNGRKNSVHEVLRQLQIIHCFDYITHSEILGQAKPSPEAYNYTMLMLGVKPEECIVFEDNQVGFDSALAAGIEDVVEVTYDRD